MRQRAGLARFTADQHLPRDEDGPVFAEPWQAEAFALTVRLHEAGCFIWPEGAGAIAEVLRAVRGRGELDDGSRFYCYWLTALERLLTRKQVLSATDLDRRRAACTQAYLSTPHGQSVALPAASQTPSA